MSLVKQAFMVEIDGQIHTFSTAAEANNFARKPLIVAELVKLTSDADSAEFIFENRTAIEEAYKAGKVRRVSKAEKKALEKALDEVQSGFIHDHKDAILASFRWPSVARDVSIEDALKSALLDVTIVDEGDEGDEAFADWLYENKAAVQEAFKAGQPKREVSPKASAALAKHQLGEAEKKLAMLKKDGDKDAIAEQEAKVESFKVRVADTAKDLADAIKDGRVKADVKTEAK